MLCYYVYKTLSIAILTILSFLRSMTLFGSPDCSENVIVTVGHAAHCHVAGCEAVFSVANISPVS